MFAVRIHLSDDDTVLVHFSSTAVINQVRVKQRKQKDTSSQSLHDLHYRSVGSKRVNKTIRLHAKMHCFFLLKDPLQVSYTGGNTLFSTL